MLIANRYEIKDIKAAFLGSGGMGTVYRGVDTRNQQMVAIKELRADVVERAPDILVRFQREAEVLRRLHHPNIVAILDAIEQDDKHYLIMEYVSGGSLSDIMYGAGSRLPINQVLSIALELADALSRAHHIDIIHRDIKPANVLLAEDGTPRLTDFGVARIGNSTRMTQEGEVIGTISYLAPEAFSGKIDARSDIWAFGVMLFEMLSGEHPFEVASIAETINAIITRPPPELSLLSPDLPPTVITLVHHMLEKNPDDRTGSMRLIAAQLEAIIAGHEFLPENTPTPTPHSDIASVASRIATGYAGDVLAKQSAATTSLSPAKLEDERPTNVYHVPLSTTPTKRPLPRILIGGAAVVLIMILAAAALLLMNGEEVMPEIALECTPDVDKYTVIVADLEPIDTSRIDPVRFIIDDLRQHFEVDIRFSGIVVCHYPAIITSGNDALTLAQKHQALLVVWGTYNDDFADVQINIGYPPGFKYAHMDRETQEIISNTRSRITDPLTQSLVPHILGALVTFQNDNGDGYEAARTIAIMTLIGATPAESVGKSIATYSVQYFANFTRNEDYALEQVTNSLDTQTTHIAFSSRSGLLLRMGDIDGARRDAETALRLGPEGYSFPYYILANIALAEGDAEGTLKYYTEIIEARPDDWFALTYRGAVYYLLGDYEQARIDLERSIELGPKANFPYMLLLMLSIREGDLLGAQSTMQTVLREFPDPSIGSLIVETTFGDNFPILFAPVFSAFGNLTLGQYTNMLANIEEAIAIEPDLIDLYMMQGYAYCNLGDYEAAEASYNKAIELEPDFTVLYVFRAEARRNTGNLLGALGDVSRVMDNDPQGIWGPVIMEAQSGALNCTNLFDYDLAGLYEANEG